MNDATCRNCGHSASDHDMLGPQQGAHTFQKCAICRVCYPQQSEAQEAEKEYERYWRRHSFTRQIVGDGYDGNEMMLTIQRIGEEVRLKYQVDFGSGEEADFTVQTIPMRLEDFRNFVKVAQEVVAYQPNVEFIRTVWPFWAQPGRTVNLAGGATGKILHYEGEGDQFAVVATEAGNIPLALHDIHPLDGWLEEAGRILDERPKE